MAHYNVQNRQGGTIKPASAIHLGSVAFLSLGGTSHTLPRGRKDPCGWGQGWGGVSRQQSLPHPARSQASSSPVKEGPGGEGLEAQWVGALASEQGLGPGAPFQQGSSSSSVPRGPLTRSTSSAPSRCWGGLARARSHSAWLESASPHRCFLLNPSPPLPDKDRRGGQGRPGEPQSPPWTALCHFDLLLLASFPQCP